MLELGTSKHWTAALRLLTNEGTLNANALFEYFQPLYEWLVKENNKYPNDKPGW
jgi:peptidyl-dipeptidase A